MILFPAVQRPLLRIRLLGYDERHPQNKLPYVDKVTYLVIPDQSTALAAFRTGKIDDYESATYQYLN